jgi:hypothetical protein
MSMHIHTHTCIHAYIHTYIHTYIVFLAFWFLKLAVSTLESSVFFFFFSFLGANSHNLEIFISENEKKI